MIPYCQCRSFRIPPRNNTSIFFFLINNLPAQIALTYIWHEKSPSSIASVFKAMLPKTNFVATNKISFQHFHLPHPPVLPYRTVQYCAPHIQQSVSAPVTPLPFSPAKNTLVFSQRGPPLLSKSPGTLDTRIPYMHYRSAVYVQYCPILSGTPGRSQSTSPFCKKSGRIERFSRLFPKRAP